ncbi:MAG: FTR1 family iron permease [Nitrososphaeria archaeon]
MIAFRETFEAALIISIVLFYLSRAGESGLRKYAYYGLILSIFLTLISGSLLWLFYDILEERFKLLFESLSSFLAFILLSWTAYWMTKKGKSIKTELEQKVEVIVKRARAFWLVVTVFTVVFMEGLEMVIFLTPLIISNFMVSLYGIILGVVSALLISTVLFLVGMKVNLRNLFYFTSILLVFVSGGLLGHGLRELIEYIEMEGTSLGFLV